ncbi:MAG: bifunctional methionine sulfoxide reductase B/A protein [Flavobacteriaceae bacterium]|nr:bifunctional methionine sulfoxide reductase B/A protein [Flavobacteriaceae bacterium]
MKKYVILVGILLLTISCHSQNTKKTMEKKDETYWKKKLTPEQYVVLREKGTERPNTGKFLHHKEKGIYKCAGCGNELFTDAMKFDSHCGWPSFDKEIEGGKIKKSIDLSHGMKRIEITCANCGGHLGHLFDDGITETGMRYCVNSVSLSFEKAEKTTQQTATITLGAGCFWCVETIFEQLEGVFSVTSGYSGGTTENPTYKEVCTGTTEHAEVVHIQYNPTVISLEKLLEVFFTVHDPTTLNRQGNDIGTQYRSAIFYHTEEQQKTALGIIKKLNREKVFAQPIVTEVTAFTTFYKAENYHQDYYNLNQEQPYCKMVIQPKVKKFTEKYRNLLKK